MLRKRVSIYKIDHGRRRVLRKRIALHPQKALATEDTK